MIGNTNVPTMVHSSNEATYTEQDEINNLNEDLLHLHNGLGDNINDANNESNHDNTNFTDNGLKSNNTLGANIVKKGRMVLWIG